MDKTIDRWTDPDGNGYAFKDTVARAQNRATIDKMNTETADRKSELDIERKRIDNLIKELPATAGEYQQSKLVLHSYDNTAVKCTTTSGNYTNVPAFTTDQGGPLSSLYTKKSNYQIAVNKSGLYLFELRIHVNSLIANKRVELAPFVNDTRNAALASSYNTAGNFTLTQVAALPLWLSANDTVDFRIAPIEAAEVSLQLGDVLVYAIDWEDKFKIPDYTGYAAETKDIRTGADGTVYGTAGEAVRKQIGNLTEDLVDLESNVIFLDNPKAEYTIQQSALLNTNDGSVNTYNQSAYQITKVNVTNVYEMTILQDVLKNYGVAFFDESGTWLARVSLKKGVATTVNVPEGATSAWYNEPNGSVPNVVCATSLPTYNSIKDDVDDIGTEYTNNLFDPSESLVEYGFNPLTGSIGTKAGFMVTNPIAVQSGEVVEVNNPTAVAFGGSIIPSPLYYQTYDRNMFLLATQNTVSNGRVTIAQDGFIRFCFSSGNKYNAKSVSNVTIHKVDGDYKPYVKFGYDLPKLNILKDNITPMTYNWYGKKWVSVGDSNTSRRQYQKYVVDALGLQWANVAEGGKRVQYFATDEKIAEIIAQNPDVITIMLGTNNTSESGIGSLPPYPSNDMEIIDTSYDWSQQTYKETYVRLDSNGNPVKDASGNIIYDTVNEMTYASAMMTIVSKIQTALPYCIIILMSPMYGSIVGNGRPKEVYTAGAYKQEAILKEISERFGCEYINVQNLMSMYNCNPYFDDEEDGSKQWTHWNEKAGKKLAQRIIMTMLYNEPIEKISYR